MKRWARGQCSDFRRAATDLFARCADSEHSAVPAHETKLSNVTIFPACVTWNALSYSLPQTTKWSFDGNATRRLPGSSFSRKDPAGYAAAGALRQGRYRWVYGER